jgi:periplasmic protein TonB
MHTAAGGPPTWILEEGDKGSPRLFAATLILAVLAHALIIYTVHFSLPAPKSGKQTTRPLEVIVLRNAAPTDKAPDEADAVSQVNREGGGTEEPTDSAERHPPEPLPPPVAEPLPSEPPLEVEAPPPLPEPVVAPEPPPEPVQEPVLTAAIEPAEPEAPTAPPVPEPRPEPVAESEPPPAVTAAQILASRSLEIAKLSARIEETSTAYAHRPRRKAISASTREYKYAAYLEAWRRKVEQIGNLNYPEEAKKHKLYGNLILHVAVRSDGSLESVRVLRSSGFDILDQAAVNIVKLAAPFSPFPSDIRSDTDVLDITRTWQFLSSNRLGWEN